MAAARRVTVVAGPGNNGGDGFVVARLAANEGLPVSVILIGDAARIAGDARTAYRRLLEAVPGLAPVRGMAEDTECIVDALFGTGLTREVSGAAAGAVRAMNASPAPVLALDVPSGIHSDTGRVLGGAVRATVTVSFIGLKQGLFTGEGRECGGEIVYRDLGVPDHVFARVKASARRMAYRDYLGLIGVRRRDAHKGPVRSRVDRRRRPWIRRRGMAGRRGRRPDGGGTGERRDPSRARRGAGGFAARDDGARDRVARRPRPAARPRFGGCGSALDSGGADGAQRCSIGSSPPMIGRW